MDHGDDVHLIGRDVVHDSVRAFHHFPYLWEIGFGDDAAGFGELSNLLGAPGEAVNDSQCVLGGALSDIGVNVPQMVRAVAVQ